MTKLGAQRIHVIRARGGNLKHRALRLDTGNFTWGSEGILFLFLIDLYIIVEHRNGIMIYCAIIV